MHRPTLYIFVGFPGSGKTTVARMICAASGARHFWADHERQLMFGEPTHSESESQALYDRLNQRTGELLRSGTSVVFDTNFSFYKDRELLRKIGRTSGADVKLIWLTTDRQLAKERATHGQHAVRNGYDVSMSPEVFEHIAAHLEPPQASEQPIKLIGQNLQQHDVLRAVGLA